MVKNKTKSRTSKEKKKEKNVNLNEDEINRLFSSESIQAKKDNKFDSNNKNDEVNIPETANISLLEKSEIKNLEGLKYLKTIKNNSVNLILTDPPYIISHKTGMDEHSKVVKNADNTDIYTKTESEWQKYKTDSEWKEWFKDKNITDKKKQAEKLKKYKKNYIKYGSLYGKKYAVTTDYGNWDTEFTMEILEKFISEYYRVLKDGGTLILFFDLWKITQLKDLFEKYKFKQFRFIEWIKTNPQPLNSSINYLTNCREIALVGIKKSKPTFNTKYHNGIYNYPLQGGKDRFHPTQKNLKLFEELIKNHSNENDIVLDTFQGSGTTSLAAKNTNRIYKGCEISKEYYDKILNRLT